MLAIYDVTELLPENVGEFLVAEESELQDIINQEAAAGRRLWKVFINA